MDEELKSLEEELRQLRPRDPSVHLVRRLDLAMIKPRRGGKSWMLWVAFPAAAGLGLLALNVETLSSIAAKSQSTASFKPVAAENLLLDASDEGYTTFEDGTPARRVRRSYIDTITWKDPRTNASLTWSVPREEVRVIPVVFQ
ncbi:MAG: hypothetical protein ABIO94_10695 [Opitutaceae bacterium]